MFNSNLFEIYNKETNENEILKLIITATLNNEDFERYITSINQINSLNVRELVKYSKILNEHNYIYLIMPKYVNCLNDIKNPVEYFEESGIYDVMMSICRGTLKIHENGLINGNINPSNILLDEKNEIKMSDYCKMELYKSNRNIMNMTVDKVVYMSPELLENKELNDKSDIWSIGCILYYILSNNSIFEGESVVEIINKILKCEYKKLKCECEVKLNVLLKKMIVKRKEDRISMTELMSEFIEICKDSQLITFRPVPNSESINDIIGIDIGISSSKCGIYKNPLVTIIPNRNGKSFIENYVYYNPNNDKIVVGSDAKNYVGNECNIVYDSQKFIGLSFYNSVIQEGMKKWPFKIINDYGTPKVELCHNNDTIHLSAIDISCEIMKEIKKHADRRLGQNECYLTKAIITYPFYFTKKQINETKVACEKAYIVVVEYIPESICSAIAYLYKYNIKSEKYSLVYNFTQNRFDVTICYVNNDSKRIKIIGYEYDLHLGGDDVDNTLVNYYLDLIERENGITIDKIEPKAIVNLQKACEKAKIELICRCKTYINSDLLLKNGVDNTLNRDDFEIICRNIFNKTMTIVDNVINRCRLSPFDISHVVLCGESSKILSVQKMLTEKFGIHKMLKSIDCEEVCSYGAAVYGNYEEFHFKIVNSF